MHVVHHSHLGCERSAGLSCRIAAGPSLGVHGFQVWLLTLDAGASTHEASHRGELVAIVQQGSGKLLIDGGPQRFHAPCSLLIPAGTHFHLTNTGSTPLHCVWVFTQRPEPLPGSDASSSSFETPTP